VCLRTYDTMGFLFGLKLDMYEIIINGLADNETFILHKNFTKEVIIRGYIGVNSAIRLEAGSCSDVTIEGDLHANGRIIHNGNGVVYIPKGIDAIPSDGFNFEGNSLHKVLYKEKLTIDTSRSDQIVNYGQIINRPRGTNQSPRRQNSNVQREIYFIALFRNFIESRNISLNTTFTLINGYDFMRRGNNHTPSVLTCFSPSRSNTQRPQIGYVEQSTSSYKVHEIISPRSLPSYYYLSLVNFLLSIGAVIGISIGITSIFGPAQLAILSIMAAYILTAGSGLILGSISIYAISELNSSSSPEVEIQSGTSLENSNIMI
jgi:hypothetical protein